MSAVATTPVERRELDRWDWSIVYRHMRMMRGRALHRIYKSAGLGRNRVASVDYLTRKLLTILSPEADDTLSIKYGPFMRAERMGHTDFDRRNVYALVTPDGKWPDSSTRAWALAQWAITIESGYGNPVPLPRSLRKRKVDDLTPAERRLLGRSIPTTTYARYHAGLYGVLSAFGWAGHHTLARFITDSLEENWRAAVERHVDYETACRKDRFAELRRKWRAESPASIKAVA